eukprot:9183689-Alexandrium_andersonii.AAC.1
MSASLVGSEMCIRDRTTTDEKEEGAQRPGAHGTPHEPAKRGNVRDVLTCLLYTSDAADDM